MLTNHLKLAFLDHLGDSYEWIVEKKIEVLLVGGLRYGVEVGSRRKAESNFQK